MGRHYTGVVSDYIQGVGWPDDPAAPRRAHEEQFMDLQLVVGPSTPTVEESLCQYVTPERREVQLVTARQWLWAVVQVAELLLHPSLMKSSPCHFGSHRCMQDYFFSRYVPSRP